MTSSAARPAHATRANGHTERGVESHSVAGPTSPARGTPWAGAVAGLARPSVPEPGSSRRADGRVPLDALRRQHRGRPTIRRQKILGATAVVHINDYHFIDRLALGRAPDSGTHDVIVTPFEDFDGLAAAARLHPREGFEFDGVQWGWKSQYTELFPIADGKVCIKLTTQQIEELTTRAVPGEGGSKEDFVSLTSKDAEQRKVVDAFRSVPQRLPTRLLQVELPIETTANKLLSMGGVKFDPASWWDKALEEGTGKDGKAEAFLWGPTGGRQLSHLHLFLRCAAKKKGVQDYDHPFTIYDFHMTTSHRVHLVLRDGEVVGKSAADKVPGPGHPDAKEVTEMTLVCELLSRAPTAGAEVTSAKAATSVKPEKTRWQKEDAAAENSGANILLIAHGERIRPAVMGHFLQVVARMQPGEIAEISDGTTSFFDQGYADDIAWLRKLDQAAEAARTSEEKVVALLDPTTYPSTTDGVVPFYEGLINSLRT